MALPSGGSGKPLLQAFQNLFRLSAKQYQQDVAAATTASSRENTEFVENQNKLNAAVLSANKVIVRVVGDGNCFFRWLCSNISLNPDGDHSRVRNWVVTYINQHRHIFRTDGPVHFTPHHGAGGEALDGAQPESAHLSDEEMSAHCKKMSEVGCFATVLEYWAVAHALHATFFVWTPEGIFRFSHGDLILEMTCCNSHCELVIDADNQLNWIAPVSADRAQAAFLAPVADETIVITSESDSSESDDESDIGESDSDEQDDQPDSSQIETDASVSALKRKAVDSPDASPQKEAPAPGGGSGPLLVVIRRTQQKIARPLFLLSESAVSEAVAAPESAVPDIPAHVDAAMSSAAAPKPKRGGKLSDEEKSANKAERKAARMAVKDAAKYSRASAHAEVNAAINAAPQSDEYKQEKFLSLHMPIPSHLARDRAPGMFSKRHEAKIVANAEADAGTAVTAAALQSAPVVESATVASTAPNVLSPISSAVSSASLLSAPSLAVSSSASPPPLSPITPSALAESLSPAAPLPKSNAGQFFFGPNPSPSALVAAAKATTPKSTPPSQVSKITAASRVENYSNPHFVCVGKGATAVMKCMACKETMCVRVLCFTV